MQIYVSGIHTDVGKTHFSAAFCANFNYDYFKLIQAGTP
ncbi:TPA: ATP-dependent dethiobiotin synthetase BioD, partial [Campylobacter jejuni]|nr:ATP-dependent dethiobiotin synthetase BioD [Campylobacter jejuni]